MADRHTHRQTLLFESVTSRYSGAKSPPSLPSGGPFVQIMAKLTLDMAPMGGAEGRERKGGGREEGRREGEKREACSKEINVL